jgi:hypothetical protein
LTGTGTLTAARDQVRFTRGDVLLDPTGRPYTADTHDCPFAVLRVPRPAAAGLAEERTGLPAADLRFESIAPVSASARALWSHTAAFICRQLLGSGITQTSPTMAPFPGVTGHCRVWTASGPAPGPQNRQIPG